MNHKILILILLMLTAPGGRPIAAALAADLPAIEISAADTVIALGDSVSIRCTVSIPTGFLAGEPRPGGENPYLDMERRAGVEEKTGSGTIRRYDYLAYVFSPDSVRVGPFAVSYVAANGDSGEVVSNVLDIPVAGFIDNPDVPSKPNRIPFEISGGGVPWWLWGALAACAAAVAAYFLLRKKTAPAAAVAVERPLDEVGEFERIRSLHLRESGQVKELYAQVSTAMRGFVHRNMGFEALYSTTDETRRKLSRSWKDRETADAIRAIFEESDMVKFAKYVPPETLSDTVIDRAIVPVRKVLDFIAAERERERIAEEERRRAAASAPAPAPVGGPEQSGDGEEGRK